MNKESKKFAKEIEELNPDIIVISGSRDPTYSSDSFCEVFIPKMKVQFGKFLETLICDQKISDWIDKAVKTIDDNYELVKYKDIYVVGEYDVDEIDEYVDDKNGNLNIDYGGSVELIYLEKMKG